MYYKPPGTGVSGQVSDGINEFDLDLSSAITALTLQYDFDPATLTAVSSYHHRKADTTGGENYLVPLTSLIATNGADIVQGLDSNTYDVDADIYTQELRLNSRGSGDLKWTVGAFYLKGNVNGSQEVDSDLVIPIIGSSNIVDQVYEFSQQEVAGFGEVTYTMASRWDLTGGLRVSHYTIDSRIDTGGYIPVFSVLPSDYVHTRFDDAGTPVDPRVSLAYRANPDLTLYTQAARGYRVGGVNLTSGLAVASVRRATRRTVFGVMRLGRRAGRWMAQWPIARRFITSIGPTFRSICRTISAATRVMPARRAIMVSNSSSTPSRCSGCSWAPPSS